MRAASLCLVAEAARAAVHAAVSGLSDVELDTEVAAYLRGSQSDPACDWHAWLRVEIDLRAGLDAEAVYPRGEDDDDAERRLANQYAWAASMHRRALELGVTAACVLLWRDGRVLVVCDRDGSPLGLPGGKRERGESVILTAARELAEETGVWVAVEDLSLVYVGPAGGHPCAGYAASLHDDVTLRPEPGRILRWLEPAELLTAASARFRTWNRAALAAGGVAS